MRRIVPEEVIAAYRELRLRPAQNFSHCETGQCCAVGALARALDEFDVLSPWSTDDECCEVLETLGFDSDYLGIFIVGFDGEHEPHAGKVGYEDGVAVRLACVQEFGELPVT